MTQIKKPISVQSRKQKGRGLQKHVVARILHYFPELKAQDVTSRSMGAAGEDVLLSPKATDMLPVAVECKFNKAMSIYKFYEQAITNANGFEPIVVIKQNHSKPLVLVDLDVFLALSKRAYNKEFK